MRDRDRPKIKDAKRAFEVARRYVSGNRSGPASHDGGAERHDLNSDSS